MYSANWGAWLASAAWAHRWWLPALGRFREVLFPGLLATALGLTGLCIGSRRRAADNAAVAARDVVLFYAAIIVIAFWASFGPNAGLYTALFNTIPLFAFLRAPARMGIMVTLGLTVLSGVALASILSSRPRRTAIATALVLAVAAELMRAPLSMLSEAEPLPRAYSMLASLPRGPVVELPFFSDRQAFPRHAVYMLNSTAHWQPLVNGYSDHIPDDFRQRVRPLSSFPTRESFLLLGEIGARYVVFHLNLYDRRARERVLERLRSYERYLRPLIREDDVWLYEIVDWPN
jgi:hypothetical protein